MKFSGVLGSVIVVVFALAQANVARAADANPPEQMTYQGYLVDQDGNPLGDPAPENYDMVFRIYNVKQAGGTENLLWAEQQTVTVDMGYFSVLLGEGSNEGSLPHDEKISTAFIGADSSDRYIGITVKGLSDGDDVEIAPRLRLVASPFTFLAAYARQADKIVGADGDVLTTDGGNIGIGNASPDAKLDVIGSIKASGAVDIGEDANVLGKLAVGKSTAPSAALDVVGKVKASGGLDVVGNSSIIDGTLALTPSGNNNALEINPASGTSYKLSLRSDSSASYIRNNSSQQDLRLGANSLDAVTIKPNGDVGIGTTNPRGKLDVYTGNSTVPGLIIDRYATGHYRSELVQAADGLAIRVGYGATEPTEKMRIKHDGHVGIGTTSPATWLHIGKDRDVAVNSSGLGSLMIGARSGGHMRIDSNEIMAMSNDSPTTLFLMVNGGDVRIGSTTYSSDQRLKRNIRPIKYGLSELRELRPVSYDWRLDLFNLPGTQLGFVAQDVQKVLPEVVTVGENTEDSRFKDELGLNVNGILPVVVASVQELDKENRRLQGEVETLQDEVALLKASLSRLEELVGKMGQGL